MTSHYRPLGNYIREIDIRDTDTSVDLLLGVSIQKKFIPSIANTIGTDMSTYKVIKKNQFAYGPVTSRNGDKVSIALLKDYDEAVVSQAYTTFEVIDLSELHPEYLMMWFRRPEFDRYARFMSHGSAREIFGWEEMCNTNLPIPHPTKQLQIIREYKTVVDRISLNERFIDLASKVIQTIFRHWFIEFELPAEPIELNVRDSNEFHPDSGKPIPAGWIREPLEFLVETTIGGDWGTSLRVGNNNTEVVCLRGTDIPSFQQGRVGTAPTRFILANNSAHKSLRSGQIVIEISGGSPTQSTGRTVLIMDEHFKNKDIPIICSNFCRAISLKDDAYSCFLYAYVNYLYQNGVLFNFENSTIGLKNFDITAFLTEQQIVVPPRELAIKFQETCLRLMRAICLFGRENEILMDNHDLMLSDFLLGS